MTTLGYYNIIFFDTITNAQIARAADAANFATASTAGTDGVPDYSQTYMKDGDEYTPGPSFLGINKISLTGDGMDASGNALPTTFTNANPSFETIKSDGTNGPTISIAANHYFYMLTDLGANVSNGRYDNIDADPTEFFSFNSFVAGVGGAPDSGGPIYVIYAYVPTFVPPPCFLKGSKILCQIENEDKEVPIEEIKEGMLVKTYEQGYKAAHSVSKTILNNPGHSKRIANRLYKCSKINYPEMTEDLYITGGHGIMLDRYTNDQAKDIKQKGSLYMLRTFKDSRAEPFMDEGSYDIYNIALENKNKKMNYSIWANGLLVESIAIKDIASMQ